MPFVLWLALTALQLLLAPKPPKPRAATLDDFDVPTADPERSIPVVFGTVAITGANVVWYGHLRSAAIKKKQLFSSVVIGYRYYMGMHMSLCYPADRIEEIKVGDRVAWSGSVANGQLTLDAPNLFGGDEKEGGIAGTLDVLDGDPAQGTNSYLAARLGSPLPAFRGVLSLVARQIYIGTTPYLKPWQITVRRIDTLANYARESQWYPSKADINGDLNPAHLLREVLTSVEWGMSHPAASMDDAVFMAAADTLHAEGLGLSLQWVRSEPIEQFHQGILDTIGAVLTQDEATAKVQLKLIRADYVVGDLLLLDESNTLELASFERRGWGETINEVTVVYRDRATNKDTPVTVQNAGNIQMQGAAINETLRYPGISNADNALRVAQRELLTRSSPLSRIKIIANRDAAGLRRGGVFRFSWADHGLVDVPYRVLEVDLGELRRGQVTIDAVEDVFGLPDSTYVSPQASQWVSPSTAPAPLSLQGAEEAGYYDVQTGLEAADIAALGPDFGLVIAYGARNADDATDLVLATRVSPDEYQEVSESGFTPTAELAAPLDAGAGGVEGVVLGLANPVDIDLVAPGAIARLGPEIVLITAIDPLAPSVTVSRGMLDTVPQAHAAGARLWFTGTDRLGDPTDRPAGLTVGAKLLPSTTQGRLDEAAATGIGVTLDSRYHRPYPPGAVRLNGVLFADQITGELTVTWAHRDRVTQGLSLTTQAAGNEGPEAGTTYTLRLYGEADTLLRTESGLTGTGYTWADEIADAGLGRLNNSVRVELEAVRGGLVSWSTHSVAAARV